MSSLSAALTTASNALDVLSQAIGVVQNNVSNASTPGYVTQTLNLTAAPFDFSGNLTGGVRATSIQDGRNLAAEQAVWNANQQAGQSTQQASSLSSLQNYFDVSGTSGIPAALSSLYSAFGAWSSNSTDSTSRQQVITAASTFAQSVNETADNVKQLSDQTDNQISSTVNQINALTSQIADLNGDIQQGGDQDAGVQSQLYNSLEQLSNLVPISVQTATDGTTTVLLNGQSPLVEGDTSNPLQVGVEVDQGSQYPGASPNATIVTSSGQDVTALASEGQLGGLLSFRNTTIPSIIGNPTEQGSLNQLAQSVADTVNGILTAGQISAGPPPVSGQALFSYGTPLTEAASTLSTTSISASQLAAISTSPTASANGVPVQLSALSTSSNLNGVTFTDFYSNIASGIGQSEATASSNQEAQAQVLSQAQTMRAQLSGVSLNQQAALLMQYQESYQAAAQVISTINQMTQSLLTTMQQVLS